MSDATAGTASDGYRVAPVACFYEGEPVEYGERPRCRWCGREREVHLPVLRKAEA